MLALALLVAGCQGQTPERARIEAVRTGSDDRGGWIEVTQRLRLSDAMLEALDNGIPLRLGYRFTHCAGEHSGGALVLRYSPLGRHYSIEGEAGGIRRAERRGALEAMLDRVRLPSGADAPCVRSSQVVLDLTALPTPLRLPAFGSPERWRLVSPEFP